MARIKNGYGKKDVYCVARMGLRSTHYWYTTLSEAVEKYDELCRNRDYVRIELEFFPSDGKYIMERIYTTDTNDCSPGVKYRNISKKR